MRRFVFLKGLTMADSNYILTPEGRQKLEEELHYLETEKRAEVGERIKVAREFGDISENSEYDDAKEEQSKNASRVAEIRKILSTAKVSAGAGHVMAVSIGCTVEIQEQGKDKTCAFTIVGTTETNSLEHKISNESPVGSALMGHAKGDVIEVTSPSGVTRHYTIVKISR